MLRITFMNTSCKSVLRRMPRNTSNNTSTLSQVMAWCRRATSHYLIQCHGNQDLCRHMASPGRNELTDKNLTFWCWKLYFPRELVNTKAIDTITPCVTKPSTVMASTMQNKMILENELDYLQKSRPKTSRRQRLRNAVRRLFCCCPPPTE